MVDTPLNQNKPNQIESENINYFPYIPYIAAFLFPERVIDEKKVMNSCQRPIKLSLDLNIKIPEKHNISICLKALMNMLRIPAGHFP